LAVALNFNSYVYRFRGEVAAARELSDEQIRLCVEQGIFPQHVAWGRFGGGWALARIGDVEAGLVAMREGLRGFEETNVRRLRAYNMAVFAEACIQAGRFDEARRALTDALDSPERWWEPEVHRLHGTLALAMRASASQEAEQNFYRALSLARAYQSRSLELRAATSFARLWAEQGERQKAHDLLAPVYGWFTEGFDTADLKDAKALLDALS
jgi:predicted ATPase